MGVNAVDQPCGMNSGCFHALLMTSHSPKNTFATDQKSHAIRNDDLHHSRVV